MEKRLNILLFVPLIFSLDLEAQEKDFSDLYFRAFKTHITNFYENENANNIIYVEQDIYTTLNIPGKIANHKIEILSNDDIFELTKSKKRISLISIRPAIRKNGKLIISVINVSVTRRRKHTFVSNVGGTSLEIIGEKIL